MKKHENIFFKTQKFTLRVGKKNLKNLKNLKFNFSNHPSPAELL